MMKLDRRTNRLVLAAVAATSLVTLTATTARAVISAADLRTEYQADPAGVDATTPRLSWTVAESDPAARGQRQTAYQVRVATARSLLEREAADLWDSGRVTSDQQNQLAYAGRPLGTGQACWWQVRVWDRAGEPSAWTAPATWSMGLLRPADWTAQWIDGSPAQAAQGPGPFRPCVYLRKTFAARPNLVRATVHATAAGVYALSINGGRVGQDYLAPGWTEYGKRLYYQTYDVTSAVRGGAANAIGVTLGDGWYGLQHDGRGQLAARVQLRLEYADGTAETVGTDPTWRTSAAGPIRSADLYNGERYDARREIAGWDTPGFDDAAWTPAEPFVPHGESHWRDVTAAVRAAVAHDAVSLHVDNKTLGGDPFKDRKKALRVRYSIDGRPAVTRTVAEQEKLDLSGHGLTIESADYGGSEDGPPDVRAAVLQAHPGSPVRRTAEVRPVAVLHPAPGVAVYDLGQNVTGFARLSVTAPAGTVVRLRFAEVLNPDGTIYTANLRGAEATDTYTCRGDAAGETWEPRFTFHGFRYVELTGAPADAGPAAITGVVLGSAAPFTSSFACSSPLLNQLQHNIVWGQRSNYLEVPTDCPQRDERRGWSGDAEAFIGTGTYNQDLAPFFTAWLRSYDDGQADDGAFPDIAPHNVGGTSPGWGDAGVICPWTLYQRYGDLRLLAEGYPHMVRWVEYLRTHSDHLVRPAEGYGDWLSIRADTPKDLIATAFFARSTDLVGQVAAALGKTDEAAKYAELHRQIAAAFRRAFVTADAHVKGETQTGYLLALGFDLLEPGQRPPAVARLRQLVHDRSDHLSVGFLGVNLLLPVLADTGDVPLAYTLLENDTYPSWGYPIRQGATTVWERWNGWTREGGFETPIMNSFNHYAYGSCGQWIFDTLAGLSADRPGFAHLVVHPRPGGDVTFADATYDSIRGPVAVHWGLDGSKVHLAVTVPPNLTATVYVPTAAAASVTEGDAPAAQAAGVRYVRSEPDAAVYEVDSGRYAFTADRLPATPATRPATRP